MNIHFPIIELLDRLAIAEIKFQRTNGGNHHELEWYQRQVHGLDMSLIQDQYLELKQIHDKIWDLESELKSGCEHLLDLAEIGRRAVIIRNHNNKRIALKNSIAEKFGCTVKEIKQDHLSE